MKTVTLQHSNFFIITILATCIFLSGCKPKEAESRNEEGEENEMYDGPGLAAQFEFERTMDPATGRVPRERYLLALEKTIESKNQNASLIGGLPWIERGPNSDAYGPYGNSRANNDATSGRIRAVMVDSSDATHKTVFVGGVCGGLWKTTDITASPANWAPVSDNLSNLAIAAICQDPRPGFQNIMYFCTGESYYNVDAVQGNGVFKSTDYGETWTFLSNTASYVNGTRILCDYLGNIYLATRGTGLLRSTAASGGVTWTTITPSSLPNSDITDMEISSTSAAGRLHITCGSANSSNGYRFTDIPVTVTSAAGWTSSTTALPSFINRIEIACSGSTLYALPGDNSDQVPTIYKSTDGGANWATTGGAPASGWASGQGWYALAIDIDPSNANSFIIGGLDTWKTTNAGANWTQLSTWVGTSPVSQYVHADVHKVLWYDGGNKLIFASDGGIFYSSDKGVTIRDRNKGLRIKQFYSCAIHPSTTNYFLAGAQDNGVHRFTNAGLSSTTEVNGGDGCYVAIDQLVPANQFGSYVYNIYNISTDGGTTWPGVAFYKGTNATSPHQNFGSFVNAWDYDNTNKIIYAGSDAGEFFRWTTPLTTPAGTYYVGGTPAFPTGASILNSIAGFNGAKVTAVAVSPFTANRVYFGTNGGRVVYIDGANTAASATAGTNITGAAFPSGTVACVNTGTTDQNLICCFSNYGVNSVWVSTNGGGAWTSLDNNGVNLADMPVRWCMFYPGDNTRAFIATETGVWQTDLINGTSTVWNANPNFPAVRTDMLKYRSSDRTIAAATHGRGLWTATVPTVATADLSFQSSTDAASEISTFTGGCRGYTDYTKYMVIANAPSGAATVTLSVAGGGSATQGVDYDITTNGNFTSPAMTLNFASGSGTAQPFKIRVYDDAAVESAESFTVNYSTTGGNAQAGATNQTFTFTINDNDAVPIANASGSFAVGTYNANLGSTTPFRSNQAKFRVQTLYTAAELMSAGITTARNFTSMTLRIVTKNSTVPYTGFTISMANTGATDLSTGFVNPVFTPVYPATNFSSVVGNNLFTFSTPFAWDGMSNIIVNYCFDNSAAEAAADVTEGNSAPLGAGINATTYSNAVAGSPCTAAASFVSPFRIDATFGTTIAGTPVSTALNSSKTAYLGPFDDVYFYDGSGNIMARIKNLTAFDYGCTQVVIDRAGTGTIQFWNAVTSNYLTSKSFKIIPANNTTTGSYQLTLYYTAAEVAGFNAAATPSSFAASQIVKVSNGFYIPDVTPASPHFSDSYVSAGTNAAFGSLGNTVTATFSNTGFSGFAVGTPGNSLLTADYRSKASGNYSDGTKWEYNIFGTNYIDANQAPTSGSNVNIQAAHSITLDASQTISTGKTLTVNGTLTAVTNTISGAGAFTLAAGGTFATSNTGTNGISQNITVTGTKTFTDGANYIFNGASTAPFGSAFTTVKPNNLIAGASITLDKPVYLTGVLGFSGSSRTLTTGSNLTLGSAAAGTARINNLTKDFFTAAAISGNSIAGTATVERYIANAGHRSWHLLSARAVTGAQTIFQSWQENGATGIALPGYGTWVTSNLYTGSNGFDATSVSASILTHNQGGAGGPSWNYNIGNTNTGLSATAPAYMLFVRGDRTYTPTLPSATATSATTLRTNGTVTQGTQTGVTVSATGSGRTLVGNPYASSIDMDAIFTGTGNLNQDMMVWDPTLTGSQGVGGFRLVERNGGAYQQTPVVLGGGSTPDAASRYIQSGQAFFLKATGSNASVVFTEANKTASVSVVNPIVATPGDQQLFANLMIVNPGGTASLADGFRVRFDASYQAGEDDDIEKMGNFAENISCYRGEKKWIVEKRPMITGRDTIFMRMTNTAVKDYRFETGSFDFVQPNLTAWLEDTYLKSFTSLDLGGTVSYADFSVTADPASANPDRFRIVFAAAGPAPQTAISIKAVDYGNDIMVSWKVSNELAIQKYEVERSAEGVSFTKIHSEPAAGIPGSDVQYSWLDMNPVPGDNFYRIRSIGMGGNEKMSEVVKLTKAKNDPHITVMPNPVINHTLVVQFTNMEKGVYQLRLLNTVSQVVFTKTIDHGGGSSTQTLLLSRGLAKGSYRLEIIQAGAQTKTVKSIVIE